MKKLKENTIRLLRWSEKYTKTDMVYFASGGLWTMLTQVSGSILAFIMTITLTNILPKETFGQYRFILSIVPMIAIFTLPGIGTALTRSIAMGNEVMLQKISKIKIKYGIIGSLLSLIISLYYLSQDNTTFAYVFAISAIFIPFYETFFVYSFYFKGKQKFKTSAVYEITSKIVQTTIVILVASFTSSILFLITSFFLGNILISYLFYKKTIQYIQKQTIQNNEITHFDITRFGKNLSVVQVIDILAGNIDKLLIWHFLGAEMLAVYVIAFMLPQSISQILLVPTQNILLPKMSQSKLTIAMKSKVFGFANKSIVLTVPIILLYMLLSKHIYMIFPTGYSESLLLSKVVILSIFSIIPRQIFYWLLVSKQKKSALLTLSVTHLALTTITMAIGLYMYGILGITIAYTIKEFLMLLIQYYHTHKNLNVIQ